MILESVLSLPADVGADSCAIQFDLRTSRDHIQQNDD
jgi:hypothetical protein